MKRTEDEKKVLLTPDVADMDAAAAVDDVVREAEAEVSVSLERKFKEGRKFAVNKRDSIKNRLQKTFLLISIGIVFLMSLFSLMYFYLFTRNEATALIRNKIQIADVFMEGQKNATLQFAQSIAQDRAVQIGLDLGSSAKLAEFLFPLLEKDHMYYVTILDRAGNILADIGKSDSDLFTGRKQLSSPEQFVLQEALKDMDVSDTVSLPNSFQEAFPCYIAAAPVKRGNDIIGIVMTRFVFSDNVAFFLSLARNLNCDLAVYVKAAPIVSTGNMEMTLNHYNNVLFTKTETEKIGLTGLGLNEYRGVFSNAGDSVAVMHLYLSAFPYIRTFGVAVAIYLVIAVLIIIAVGFVVHRVSSTILNPLEQLLNGVNIVRGGNLDYEIKMRVRDEIGRISAVFNDLRVQLNEKISTIEDMNKGLERTVEDRTKTIEQLNDKMKHYLSPQLYASIVGGERDVSRERHYRKKLTIFFSDIVNFTATTESMEAEDLSTLLNSYLDNMSIIANRYEGTIDKFIGDAIMVFFGDPVYTSDRDHALRAVRMAMDMLDRLAALREEWMHMGIERPFHARIGINTGFCTIGNFGSESKMDYTIIGNNVNLASRYEAAAQPDTILMSYETYMLVKNEIECVEAGEFELKGISHGVKAYTPVRTLEQDKISKIEVKDGKEVVFPQKPVDVSHLSKKERRDLLLNLKDVFDDIKNMESGE